MHMINASSWEVSQIIHSSNRGPAIETRHYHSIINIVFSCQSQNFFRDRARPRTKQPSSTSKAAKRKTTKFAAGKTHTPKFSHTSIGKLTNSKENFDTFVHKKYVTSNLLSLCQTFPADNGAKVGDQNNLLRIRVQINKLWQTSGPDPFSIMVALTRGTLFLGDQCDVFPRLTRWRWRGNCEAIAKHTRIWMLRTIQSNSSPTNGQEIKRNSVL